MTDRQRKDRLIQTRVPQNLESTLKDEARRRRLSVSHLIRNVLEDTFNLVDNVVVEVDRVVSDSVEMAKILQRDAQRLAATARGETAHRRGATVTSDTSDVPSQAAHEGGEPDGHALEALPGAAPPAAAPPAAAPPAAALPAAALPNGALAHVYAWQRLTLNKPALCASCHITLARGERGHLGLTEMRNQPRVWLCQSCLETFDDQADEPPEADTE